MASRITVTGTILVQPSGSDRGESSSLNIGDTVTMREFADVRSRPSYRVATSGALGSVFEALDTPAVNEQLVLMSNGSEVCIRINGVVARVTSSSLAGYGTIANLDAFTLGIDSVNHAIVFQAGDTTAAKIAARINSIVGSIVATVNTAGLLVIAGSKTGDADAKAASMQYGEVALTDGVGAPLAKLGLAAGTTNGKGKDLRFLGRFFVEPPSSGVGAITSVELSGSAEIVTHVAGRAS